MSPACRVLRDAAGSGRDFARGQHMQRRYITVDVFTDCAFGGNPAEFVLSRFYQIISFEPRKPPRSRRKHAFLHVVA